MKGDKVKDRCCKSKMRGISLFFGCIMMSSIGIVIIRLKLISNSSLIFEMGLEVYWNDSLETIVTILRYKNYFIGCNVQSREIEIVIK